jgi:16S rRNA (guanine527-N7)-methyltransferase
MASAEVMAALERAQAVGPLGKRPVQEYAAHAMGFAAAVDVAPQFAVDLGTGGGLPGLILADHWTDSRWVLLDVSQRRCDLLRRLVGQLGWSPRVNVLCARAEDAGRDDKYRGRFDLVVARAFGPLTSTLTAAAAFASPGGRVVISRKREDTPPDDQLLSKLSMGLAPKVDQSGDFWAIDQQGPVGDWCPPRRLPTS